MTGRCYACNDSTTGGKPYCLKHIHMTPYFRELEKRHDAARNEIEQAQVDWRRIDPQGFVAEELVQFLRNHGVSSLAQIQMGLSHEGLKLNLAATHGYMDALIKAGRVGARQHCRRGHRAVIKLFFATEGQ